MIILGGIMQVSRGVLAGNIVSDVDVPHKAFINT